ncbi:DUF1254 domain-containing protein [Streptomyces sp. NPDC050400]|uniref:DUF1254 domain-containing protein n=1 Tax=Streptomyces sp. NPDC050400 TaxID=3365610 RepID=UPI00379D426A
MNGSNDAMPADALRSIAMPDHIGTPLGDLTFFDGLPDAATVSSSYDLLDLIRGIDVYLNTIPGASLVALRAGLRSVGVKDARTLAFTDPRANSGSYYLTPNTETTYGTTFLDLRADGPTVVENPPESLCVVDDFWFRYVADLGLAGPDKGAGGKYLFLPPGWEGEVPEGYFVFRSPTFTNWLVVRALGGVPALKNTRVYPLAQADDPPPMTYLNIADTRHNTVHSNDYSYYEEIDSLVQEEPVEALDPERAGQLAAIGIVKGKPFAPDERLRGLLAQAAPIAAGIARALVYKPRDPGVYVHPGESSWKTPFVGGSYEFLRDGARLLDARTLFHYFATVITPAMAAKTVGTGSQYAYTAEDATGAWLDGGRTYRLRLPAGIPAKNFWAMDLYDTQTRSLLQTDNPYPALSSLPGTVTANDDGSTDLYFGPVAPAGQETNWIQTVPGKAWFGMLRLYGPLEPWFDGSWRPGEFEPVEGADGG